MAQPPPSKRALVAALDPYARLIEVGVGRRPNVALALAERGHEVVAVDVDVSETARDAAAETRATDGGSLRVVTADVTALATADDRAVLNALGLDAEQDGFDAVYARNLPAELQRPAVALADRFDAACLFTTLGFEEPVVDVRRRATESGPVVYVAR
ncbi:uncharacterized UPF0146 family protein [Halorubrum trapanicum]|uniref:Uncharacterized UPF0146 family protein n=1 Tax=Halorubrum trapanicum TaxID=29284 RepID=A0A8J7UP82_9EURY|nr:UPF0146 family protein [Halorubrum trapanicum]MBP1902641.1 uncharacterized UPF0146 family protein [Halorubrum trapanicum]